MRFCTRGQESLWHWALLWQLTLNLQLRCHASRSKLSGSQVVPTVEASNTATNTPSSGKSTRNYNHGIENTSLFTMQNFRLWQSGISCGKLKINRIDGLMYCAKNECNSMITAPRRHKHPSSGAHRLRDVAVTVNIKAQFNLMAVNPIIEYFLSDLVPEYSLDSESSLVYTVPDCLVIPCLVTQIGVYVACHPICMQRILCLQSERETFILDYAFPKSSSW